MACSRAGNNSSMQAAGLQQLSRSGEAVAWVAEQLALLLSMQLELQQGDVVSSRTALAVDAGVLRKLQQQAVVLAEHLQPLQDACKAASQAPSGSKPAQVTAALTGFNTACAEGGWLPGALQEFGAAVWSALPQEYACNDPACDNTACLTEASCAKKACTDCKVRVTLFLMYAVGVVMMGSQFWPACH